MPTDSWDFTVPLSQTSPFPPFNACSLLATRIRVALGAVALPRQVRCGCVNSQGIFHVLATKANRHSVRKCRQDEDNEQHSDDAKLTHGAPPGKGVPDFRRRHSSSRVFPDLRIYRLVTLTSRTGPSRPDSSNSESLVRFIGLKSVKVYVLVAPG